MTKNDLKWLLKQHERRDEIKGAEGRRYESLLGQRINELGREKGERLKGSLGFPKVKVTILVEPELSMLHSHSLETSKGEAVILVGGKDTEGKPRTKQDIADTTRHELSHIVNPRDSRYRRQIDSIPNALYELEVYRTEKARLSPEEWKRVKAKREDTFIYNYWNFLNARQQRVVRPVARRTFKLKTEKPSRTKHSRLHISRKAPRITPRVGRLK